MLNVKKLLTKIISKFSIEEFMLTAYNGFDMAYGYGRYDKSTDSVRIYFVGIDSSNLPQNSALFTVPSKYRPAEAYGVPIIYTASTGAGLYYASLLTDGTIVQSAGSTLRGVLGLAEYKLGGVIRQLLSTFATLFNREGVAVC